jgi:hypothetical protein
VVSAQSLLLFPNVLVPWNLAATPLMQASCYLSPSVGNLTLQRVSEEVVRVLLVLELVARVDWQGDLGFWTECINGSLCCARTGFPWALGDGFSSEPMPGRKGSSCVLQRRGHRTQAR